MKILLLDDTRKRRNKLVEVLQKKKYDVIPCYSSNDFMQSIEKQKVGMVLLNLDSWRKGAAIYNCFGIAKKLENLPILFYNASMDFSILHDRPRHGKDRILFKPTEVDAIVANILDNR
ncbi:MAG: response regulator [Chitinispirillaceae bacterium]|nr:response regulator [Chitinispirillaceae bacterium]